MLGEGGVGGREIFDFFNENPTKLLLGLIHTHPGFESFLSSVDLHMLYNYACSNHSVISIVLAPELNTFPAYTLTKKGMDTLRFCQKTGFHCHKQVYNSNAIFSYFIIFQQNWTV